MYRDQKKRKEGGTRKGAGEQALAPKELSPTTETTPSAQQHHSATQHSLQQCSSTHDGPTRASAGAQLPDPHGVHERWCWCHGRSSHRQNIQTDRDRSTKRDSTKRGVGKRGAGPQKPQGAGLRRWRRALSVVGPDGRITKFGSVRLDFTFYK